MLLMEALMRVIRKGKGEQFDDLFPGTYEFKLCGGSIEPADRVDASEAKKASASSAAEGYGDGNGSGEEGR